MKNKLIILCNNNKYFIKTSLIENVGPENGAYTPLSSMDFMSDNDTLSTHSTMSATTSSGLNSVGSALRRYENE